MNNQQLMLALKLLELDNDISQNARATKSRAVIEGSGDGGREIGFSEDLSMASMKP